MQCQTEDMEMSVSVVFPEELLVAAGEDREQFVRQVMVYTLGQMYRQGQISAGLAARLLGCDRRAFYTLLSEHSSRSSTARPTNKTMKPRPAVRLPNR